MSHPLVTHVLWRLHRGGAERMVFELARRLPQMGFRVRIVAAGGGGEMEADIRAAGIPLAVGPEVGPGSRGATIRFLHKEARAHWPRIWHTHLGGDIWGGLVARKSHLHPWISTLHDLQTPAWPKSWLRGRALRAADHVVCISQAVEDHLKSTFKRTKSTSIIRLGVDTSRLRRPGSSTRRLQRFIIIGRLVPSKRVDVLLHALSLLREPWQVDILGEGPERARLEGWVAERGLRPRVRFLGSVADIYPYLFDADACLFASEDEGQGLVPLEAAGAGVPLLTSDLPTLRELFDDDSAVFVAKDASPQAWAKVIEDTMHDSTLLERAHHAQERVRDQCSIERMVREYAALYHALLTKHS